MMDDLEEYRRLLGLVTPNLPSFAADYTHIADHLATSDIVRRVEELTKPISFLASEEATKNSLGPNLSDLASYFANPNFLDPLSRATAGSMKAQQALADTLGSSSIANLIAGSRLSAPDSAIASLNLQADRIIREFNGPISALSVATDSEIFKMAHRLSNAFPTDTFASMLSGDFDPAELAAIEDAIELEGVDDGDESKEDRPRLTFGQIMAFIGWAFLLFQILQVLQGHGYSPEDRDRDDADSEAFGEHDERLAALENDLQTFMGHCAHRLNTEIFNDAPKAFVLTGANVRSEPSGTAERIARLPKDETVAIIESEGRWHAVKFFDPVDECLKDGWIWNGSLEQH